MEDLKKYIKNKYKDFKFPLLDQTNEEVKELKNKLNASGRLQSGAAINEPYKIRKNYVYNIIHERVKIEIDARKENGIRIDDNEFKIILKNIYNSIDHEFGFILSETQQDANMVKMDRLTFENSFKKRIDSDNHSLKASVKRKLENGKYELDRNIKRENHQKEMEKYDAFLCHASEDKEDIANSLYSALTKKGKKIWYDNFVLKLGDSLRLKIEEGLQYSNYGIVILSKNFFNKNWPQIELDGLFEKEISLGKKVILPIWHNISKEEIEKYSLILAGRLAVTSAEGLETVVNKILEVLDPDVITEYNETENIIKSIKILPTNIIKKPKYNKNKNKRINNDIELIVVNDNPRPINITKIILKSDFDKFFNFMVDISDKNFKPVNNIVNMQFNISPLIISGESNFAFRLLAYSSSKFEYNEDFIVEYELHINEVSQKVRGNFHIKVVESDQ